MAFDAGPPLTGAPERREWRLLYGAIILVAIGMFLVSIRSILSPFVLFLLLLLLLPRYAGSRGYTALVLSLALLTLFWLLTTVGSLVAPFVLAFSLAYILDPAVEMLARGRFPRWAAILALALPVVAAVVVGLLVGVPALVGQVQHLVARLPEGIQRLSAWVEGERMRILRWDIPVVGARLQAELSSLTPERISQLVQERQAEIAAWLWGAVAGVGKGFEIMVTLLEYLVLTPILTFYLLRDYHAITARLTGLIPLPRRAAWMPFLAEFDLLLSRYLRGQLVEATAVGVLTGLGLWISGFPYAALVGTVAGVFAVVPYLGLIVSALPVIVIALLSGHALPLLLRAAIVFAAVHLLDSAVLGPRIVGESVGLHPVWIILAITLGGAFFGFVGLLLAVPLAILAKLLLRAALMRYQQAEVFAGEATAPDV